MTRIVVDASALAAVVFNEPRAEEVARRLDGSVVCAPTLLLYELANVAWKKGMRRAGDTPAILRALAAALDDDAGICWYHVTAADMALTALATGLTAYDASYVWLAGSLGADLVTLDASLMKASATVVSEGSRL